MQRHHVAGRVVHEKLLQRGRGHVVEREVGHADVTATVNARLSPFGMSETQFDILMLFGLAERGLLEVDALTPTYISEDFDVTRSSVTGPLDWLGRVRRRDHTPCQRRPSRRAWARNSTNTFTLDATWRRAGYCANTANSCRRRCGKSRTSRPVRMSSAIR